MTRTLAWIAVVFSTRSTQVAGKIALVLHDREPEQPFLAEVCFEGSGLGSVTATGASELEAALEALRQGTNSLQAFRDSGGEVLQHIRGYGLQQFDRPLEEFFRLILQLRLGLPEKPIEGKIVSGPTPEPTGQVSFTVRVGERLLDVSASASGIGVRHAADSRDEATVHAASPHAWRAVEHFLREHRAETLGWYRDAARLRRAAGNPPPFDVRAHDGVTVVGPPEPCGSFISLRLHGAPVEIRVDVGADGWVLDQCEDWQSVSAANRSAAIGTALHYVFANRDTVAAMGLDLDLLDELYR